jgi:hypothetical protein
MMMMMMTTTTTMLVMMMMMIFTLLLLSSFFFFFLLLLLLPLGLQRHFCFGCFDGPPICTVTVQSGFTDLLVLRQYQ